MIKADSDCDYENKEIDSQIEEVSKKIVSVERNIVPELDQKELKIGRLLGKGSFCSVTEVRSERSLITKIDDDDKKSFMYECYQNNHKFAMKKLRYYERGDLRNKAIASLSSEKNLLSRLDHPHIIKLRAMSPVPFDEYSFLIIDKLESSLLRQLTVWKSKETEFNKMSHKLRDPRGKKLKKLFSKKLQVARDLASALSFIHSKDIIHRDLKPENIGFDHEGKVILFDFGLARELLPDKKVGNDKYSLTGGTGTLRYMSPEVVNYFPYGKSSDVFSFSILLWQIMKCETPYMTFTVQIYQKLVIENGLRPELDASWNRELNDTLTRSWAHFPNNRPAVKEIQTILDNLLKQIGYAESRKIEGIPRRANNSMKSKVNPNLIAGAA